ncbi:hypothetical protein [Streptomyces sp. NBC_00151]|uniref:hypothetical protein n=1 Tax=Streptomyces sp. NBC_00151 TaxID=2975669 RepID=UPI002DD88BB9|nr:hypothetical protein [Streptomyces sp. NBC_00151]WRZ44563.1 hypothetical protein OG915_45125 [Streptomyces sp. NBC_00151]
MPITLSPATSGPPESPRQMDGLRLDTTGWRPEEIDDGAVLTTEFSRWPGGRALYDPRPGDPRMPGPGVMCRFYYRGDSP